MCGKWILAHICYAFGFAPRTGCDTLVRLWGGYARDKQNFLPHKTKNYCSYRSWNYH
jgi:hypothetical protein